MKNHLQFYWWKYLIVILLPVVLWCSIFHALSQPKVHEQVNILYIGSSLDTLRLQQQISHILPELTEQPVKEISVSAELPSAGQYYSFLEARCFDYDIIIIEESQMREDVGQNGFVRLTEDLTAQFPDAKQYREMTDAGELTYGFLLFDGSRHNHFSQYYTGTQMCYAFVSPQSVNFNTFNEKGTPGNDAALKVLQYLLK